MTEPESTSNLNEHQSNVCKVTSHQKNPIQYFCLDELCFNRRLFCQACARLDHKKHRIGRIDRLIEPLSLLNINSFHEDSQTIYEELKKKIEDFYEVIDQIRNSFDEALKEIEKTTFFEVKCILETFSNQKIEEVQDLFMSPNPNEDEVRSAISTVNFLQFEGVEDCYTVKNVSDIVLCKMTKSLQKTSSKIQEIFDKLTKNVKENNFINELRLYKENLETEAKKKMHEGLIQDQILEEKESSEPETFDQLPQNSGARKGHFNNPKNIKLPSKEDNPIIKNPIAMKYKAFYQEPEETEIGEKKIRKEKNVFVVKKES